MKMGFVAKVDIICYEKKGLSFSRGTKLAKKTGPKFIQYFDIVLQTLNELGGSGRRGEIIDYIANNFDINGSELELLSDGTPRFNKNINWARFYLTKAGYIDGSQRGVWALTEKGMNASISPDQALFIFKEIHQGITQNTDQEEDYETNGEIIDEKQLDEAFDHRKVLLNILYDLPPKGFERLCQRILREAGFERVIVTGRTGDGGIDGQGILRINPFVSFQVCFQCKRYIGTVGSRDLRDFRGSIMGRAEKGIFLTTGTFSSDAKKEATRDGATPIELVDRELLIDMLEELELGLIKKRIITIYDIDEDFFNEFHTV